MGVLTEHPEPGLLLKIVTVAFVFGTFARKRNLWCLELGNPEGKPKRSEADKGTQSPDIIVLLKQACDFLSPNFLLQENFSLPFFPIHSYSSIDT